jgi:translation initiation factor IF-3
VAVIGVLGRNRHLELLSGRLLRASELFAPIRKRNHFPPALAVQGYRVPHPAGFGGKGAKAGAVLRTGGWGDSDFARNADSIPVAETTSKELRISDPRTNERIRVPEVRLVGPAGEQIGVVRIEAALRLAQEADLDLVEVAPNSKPPVVKIMDYGKFKYEAAQKAKEARRNQANTILKEVRFRLKIEAHDYTTKLKRAEGFLRAGDKVKAMILFRGREQSRPEQGVRLLRKFAEDVAEFGTVESNPTIDGRNMVMVVAPLKNKSEAKAEQNAVRTAHKQAAREAKNDAAAARKDAPAA